MRVTYRLDRSEYARFMRTVTVTDTCWLWTGRIATNGYGRFRPLGKPETAAHRVIWEHVHNEPVPDGMQLDHDWSKGCSHRNCVNPDHLTVVTPSENTRRQDHFQRRKQSCPQGHPYDEDNTYITGGRRYCRECRRERKRQQGRSHHTAGT